MPIEFRCTRCSKLLRTADDTAGRQAQCPECGALSIVPKPSEPEGMQGPAPAPPPSDNPFSPVGQGNFAGNSSNPYQSPVQPYQTPVLQAAGGAQDTKALVALILGIVSIVFCCCPIIGLVFALAGLILGIVSRQKQKSGMALSAIILSVIGLLLSILFFILNIAVMMG
jgi:DNA-directed RNA polymerase subunit RPC12/RpoP